MNLEDLKSVPQWLLIVVVAYIGISIGWALYDGRQVDFFPLSIHAKPSPDLEYGLTESYAVCRSLPQNSLGLCDFATDYVAQCDCGKNKLLKMEKGTCTVTSATGLCSANSCQIRVGQYAHGSCCVCERKKSGN